MLPEWTLNKCSSLLLSVMQSGALRSNLGTPVPSCNNAYTHSNSRHGERATFTLQFTYTEWQANFGKVNWNIMKLMVLGIAVSGVAGWLSGWVVNYLADTLPRTRRFSVPACAHCGETFPLWSYLTFQPCPKCGRSRGLRAWIVQVAMVAVSIYAWIKPHRMGYVLGLLLLTYFAVVVVIDLEHRLILHPTSVVGALLALGIGVWQNGVLPTLEGGLAGFAIMLALYYLGVLFSKYRARKLQAAGQEADGEEALGAGDVILAGILGLVLGWPIIWFALLLGILLGGVVGIILLAALLLRGLYGKQALMVFMPYGPYFIMSAFIILFLPNWITGVLGK